MTPSPPVRVLRGAEPAPHRFAELTADAQVIGNDLPAFVPLAGLIAAAPPEAPPEATPEPPPDPAASFEEGRRAGHAARDAEVEALQAEVDRLGAALAEAEAAAEARAATVDAATERLRGLWDGAVRELQPTLAALAIETAEAVLAAPLSDPQRAATEAAVAEAIDALAGEGPVVVALHPVDLLRIEEAGLAASLGGAHPGLRWEPDPSLAEGDWTATTSVATVRRVRDEMLAGLRDRLGLDPL
ncbi:hypothetical protein [Rubrivirga marina]|uniref:Flagellar assembly protein FliH/Type III secretion system HrpE domain-containing protein n=1 Tax=Rubrivirga marina TaxID=1196024 RepID=A0A271IXU5_9BACT|nr:hypothetical protein [Rubrivirga marina]PAP75768.1 hypothetical protein BSZ37_04595 [Rubrivirga marina]